VAHRAVLTAAAPPIRFSHAVVVDEQRPGFEPDVKAAGNGAIYSSVPFGFSTTQSFVWRSLDHGNSYQFVPGTIGSGKPTTCAGGGDTDLWLDSHDALYFSDLQGLTNISNSVSSNGGTTWTTSCAGAPNTPDDRMWFAGTGSVAGGNLNLYQDFDAVDNALPSGGNQLVETISHDGTHFFPVVNTATTGGCVSASQDCVTDDEGISGNQVVDPATGAVYIAHTTANGTGVEVAEGKITPGTTTDASWTESPNLVAPLCPDPTCLNGSNPEEIAGENFASIARDAAGYLYVTFTAGPLDDTTGDANLGALKAAEQIYVVHSLAPAGADPSALEWSTPQQITGSGLSAGTNTFPWIVAGSNGRVDVAWYHTAEVDQRGTCASGTGTCTLYGAGSLTRAEWSVELGQSLDAHAATPVWTTARVSESPVKYGQICTNGLGCTTGGDRSLGDFLQVTIDRQGAALVSYVFDTSVEVSDGEDAGPEVISRQISGPSLLASAGDVTQGDGPGLAMGAVSDPTGDAWYSANGSRTAAGSDLDLTRASLVNGVGSTLVATISVRSLASLAAAPTIGGPDASWMIRWTLVTPGHAGNGHIYYAGMDNEAGAGGSGKPVFFAGDTSGIPPPGTSGEHTKFITYPQTHVLGGSGNSYDPKTGVIRITIPLADVGNPPLGKRLYSVTAFTATSTAPQSATTLFNLIDATTPFEQVIGPPPLSALEGYWLVASDGGIFTYGRAHFRGSTGGIDLAKPIVGMAPTADGLGYWLVASDGGIFRFGDAQFHGSGAKMALDAPVVGMAALPTGGGYWIVTAKGEVVPFGSANGYGGAQGRHLSSPVVGMAATPTGNGYWLVTASGQVLAFGGAHPYGDASGLRLKKPVVAMAVAPGGTGYWLLGSDGGIFNYGSAHFYGSTGREPLTAPVIGIAASPNGHGYWLVATDGGVFAFGNAAFLGSMGGRHLNEPIVGMASLPAP
jgi:hypothetical protein